MKWSSKKMTACRESPPREIKKRCKALGLRGYSRLKKAEVGRLCCRDDPKEVLYGLFYHGMMDILRRVDAKGYLFGGGFYEHGRSSEEYYAHLLPQVTKWFVKSKLPSKYTIENAFENALKALD